MSAIIADGIFKHTFVNDNLLISYKVSLSLFLKAIYQ